MVVAIKKWLPLNEQLSLLQSRGLIVDNEAVARSYLERLGYYRLSGYWYPFRVLCEADSGANNESKPNRTDEFIPGSRFRDVVRLYVFDKKLRLLALDALERIEMALRVDVAHLLGEQDPIAHQNPNCFHGHFSKHVKKKGAIAGKTELQVWLEKYEQHLRRARRESFVIHNLDKYGNLPIWAAIELWDFGMMSKLFAGMKYSDQDKIAKKYGAPDGRKLAQWLRSFNFIRNVSAHHSRLWNINVTERSSAPIGDDFWCLLDNSRPFFYFCLIQKMMAVICPQSRWAERFRALAGEFPETESNAVLLTDFGVVDTWEGWVLWRLK